MSDTTMLEAALEYAKRGWLVFPLVPRGKRPLTANGFKDATTDDATIRMWWKGCPDANVGIATGSGSNLVVLDFDEKHGGMATLASLKLSTTATVATGGGGAHLYYRHPGTPVNNKAGLLQGMDVRGDGGYVVAPPSVHESGAEYAWLDENEALALLPAQFVPAAQPQAPRVAPEALLPEGERGELAKSTLKFILEGALPGTWHAVLFKAAMDLKQNGYEFDEALAKLESAGHVLDDSHDMPLLLDVYNNRTPKHPPRLAETNEERDVAREAGAVLVRAADLAEAATNYLSDKDLVKGEPTGLAGLDDLLGGGKRLGEVTCWHAEAKTGKNTLWHYLMHLWLSRSAPLAQSYASRELTPESEVLPDLLSREFGENARLAEATPERMAKYRTAISRWPLFFAQGYGHMEQDELSRWLDESQKAGILYYWFDHLHYSLVDPEDHKEASKRIKWLKQQAKERAIHIDIIIQPNKLAEGQQLSLNSMKGGAAMGQAIDNLLVLERVKGAKNIAQLSLKAGRSKLCKLGSIYLEYDPASLNFTEVEPQEEEPQAPTYAQERSAVVQPIQHWRSDGYRIDS